MKIYSALTETGPEGPVGITLTVEKNSEVFPPRRCCSCGETVSETIPGAVDIVSDGAKALAELLLTSSDTAFLISLVRIIRDRTIANYPDLEGKCD